MTEDIHYILTHSSLGLILIAQSCRGICAILIGDQSAALKTDLQNRFPAACLQAGDSALKKKMAPVLEVLDNPTKKIMLPLDLRGTAFQQRVWQALQKIPVGKTASYMDIARAIGAPQAVRAVAGACAANALAVVIPCHRVVRSDGALSGYRWGVARKKKLLALEKNFSK